MYFSRISLMSPGAIDTARLANLMCNDGYREHQYLWRLFEKDLDADRDFLFRREQIEGWPRFFMISDRLPVHAKDVWKIESKGYEPHIKEGQQLAFSLRVNPVVTRLSEAGKKQRHDVVMDLKKRMDYQSMPKADRPSIQSLIQQAGLDWLAARAGKYGFSFNLDAVRVDAYLRHSVTKKVRKKTIKFSTLDYTGLLTVMDPERFQSALFQGIGPAKAFGCGLLLVRPVR
ncbi:MAG TPA: type I-E CRISPR-associated protein Cas6/Cse3/CasE [Gammaproteobacteria bacterium]|nr:type I-E CRISPR-associated protein Cas6/Cse3/CasE [Gammaproteobacteria bacterium]